MAFFHRWFGHPSPRAFLRLVARELRKRDPMLTVHPDLDAFALVLRRGRHREAELNLAVAHAEFCEAPPLARRRVLARWCGLPFLEAQGEATLDEAIPRLLPRLRERFFYDANALYLRAEGRPPLAACTRPFAGDLALALVQDHPETMVDVQAAQLEAWGVDWDTAMTHARRNLRARSERPFAPVAPGLFRSPWEDNHDATRLVLEDLFRPLPFDGAPVAMAPHRDALLVADEASPKALARMAELSLGILQRPRALSGTALRLGPAGWEPWLPGDALLRAAFLLLREQVHVRTCEEQGELLRLLFRREGREAHVAPYRVEVDRATGNAASTTLLPRKGETWLPRAETVRLLEADGTLRHTIAWEELEAWTGIPPVPEDGLWPPRFRLPGWRPIEAPDG